MPRRSASRGRPANKKSPAASPAAKKKSTKKTPAKKELHKMDFEEGDQVMSKWPGTALYYKSKVTFVRDDDNEYDVQFEDGTVFTLKAKDVIRYKPEENLKKKQPRSRSRGRSPGRRGRATPATPKAKKEDGPTPSRSSSRARPAKPTIDPTPTRVSARIAAKIELSSDEDGKKRTSFVRSPMVSGGSASGGLFENFSFGWLQALFLMVVTPLIMLTLHDLCNGQSCKLAMPKLSRNWRDYWNQAAFLDLICFAIVLKVLNLVVSRISLLSQREGFTMLIALLSAVPVLVYRKVSFKPYADRYYYYMTSVMIMTYISPLNAFIISRWGKRSQINPKGNTGNFFVDYVNGREFNPSLFGFNLKLQLLRFSMCMLAMLNVVLVLGSIEVKNGDVNPVVLLTSSFQILYTMDAMFFEENYFYSYDAMNSGFGYALISSYGFFPFVPTLITRYVIMHDTPVSWPMIGAVALINAFGYIIFRTSETQRCDIARHGSSAASKGYETIQGVGGKRILCSGWWGVVRHPNYLGEILVQWSWALPAAQAAGRVDLLIYYLPVFATLTLMWRCREQNKKNKRKYGAAWNTYSERVKKDIFPYIF